MNYFLISNFIAGDKKGHYGIPVSRDYFTQFMENLMDDGFTLHFFEFETATYYCVYKSVLYIPYHFCFDDQNVVGIIRPSASKED